MAFDIALDAALSGVVTHPFWAIEVFHPLKTFRLLDGLGVLNIGGQDYVGYDPGIGSLAFINLDSEGVGDEASGMTFGINPDNAAIGVSLCVASAQFARVVVRMGAFNPQTGQVVGTPEVQFDGLINVPILTEVGSVTVECVSAFEMFFEADQGQRISHSFLQAISPGDLAFQYVVDVPLTMPWGRPGARPQLTRANAR